MISERERFLHHQGAAERARLPGWIGVIGGLEGFVDCHVVRDAVPSNVFGEEGRGSGGEAPFFRGDPC